MATVFRSTRAHNTVTVNGQDQAVQETSFLWSQPFKTHLIYRDETPEGTITVLARHDGYVPRCDVTHWRGVVYHPPGEWLIWDWLTGTGTHHLELNWHLGVSPVQGRSSHLLMLGNEPVQISVDGGVQSLHRAEEAPPCGWRSSCYGSKEPATTLRVERRGSLPHEFLTRIWRGEGAPWPISKRSHCPGPDMIPTRVDILNIPVDCVTMDQAVEWAASRMTQSEPKTVIAVNPEKIMNAQNNPPLQKFLRSAGLLIPDGIGVVMAARLLGLGYAERVPGAELMPRLCALAAQQGHSVFLFGADPEVNERAAAALRDQFPTLNIVGAQHGYVQADEMPQVIDRINAAAPDFLFIALGSPKQELWMATYLPRLRVKVCQGVGEPSISSPDE